MFHHLFDYIHSLNFFLRIFLVSQNVCFRYKYKKEEFDDFDYGMATMVESNVELSTVAENNDDLKTSLLEDEQATVLLEADLDKTVLLDN